MFLNCLDIFHTFQMYVQEKYCSGFRKIQIYSHLDYKTNITSVFEVDSVSTFLKIVKILIQLGSLDSS